MGARDFVRKSAKGAGVFLAGKAVERLVAPENLQRVVDAAKDAQLGERVRDAAARARRPNRRPERLRDTLDQIERTVREDATGSFTDERAGQWLRTAGSLRNSLDMTGVLRGKDRRTRIRELEERVNALYEEVFRAAMP
ncbi:hypothetical protein [uncultured Propionibacterium sp.]|uniref:hypothetical protein n=1 Tax=uncultured Propionibacterium sp. TaxID=218066 RepID=UPI0029305174|nr:hypothetical protein [uncultured Propionibacterium sp.]